MHVSPLFLSFHNDPNFVIIKLSNQIGVDRYEQAKINCSTSL